MSPCGAAASSIARRAALILLVSVLSEMMRPFQTA
jgi:hypothetical protein